MKNLILSTAVILSLSFNAIASPTEPANEKVQNTFHQVFKQADNVNWYSTGNKYEAFFVMDNVKTHATIDSKGNLVQTVRYYTKENLPANIIYSVNKAYKDKTIFGVTEVSNHNGTNYRIVLKDENNYININANSQGETELVSKYIRGDK